mmetsp:Transcript_86487/g.242107  ORF Transcript_86487/g.242107 Transcript_86487/m.242107 type:complete len:266 (+) Transcript_86487:429-1226(+)
MCRHLTLVNASVRARLDAGASSSCCDQDNRTAAATSGGSTPPFCASPSTDTQAVFRRSPVMCGRTTPCRRGTPSPDATASTDKKTPKCVSWCARSIQCDAGGSPSFPMTSLSKPSASSGSRSMQTALREAAKVRRRPSKSATATDTPPPSSAPISLASVTMDSVKATWSLLSSQFPRKAARRGSNLTWRPFAAASAWAGPPARAPPSYTANMAAGLSRCARSSFIEDAARCKSLMTTCRLAAPPLPAHAAASPRTDSVALMSSPT